MPEHTSSLFWLEQQHIICGRVLPTCKGLNPGPQPSGAVTSSLLSPSTQSLLSFLALPGGSSGRNPVLHLFLQTRVNSSRTDLSGYLDTCVFLMPHLRRARLVPAGLASALENSALAWLPGVQAHRSSPGEAVKCIRGMGPFLLMNESKSKHQSTKQRARDGLLSLGPRTPERSCLPPSMGKGALGSGL